MENIGDFSIENGVLVRYKGPGGSVTIPEGVVRIGKEAFFECSALTEITTPKEVKGIGSRAFFGCENLKSVTMEKGAVRIGNGAFRGCRGLADRDGYVIVRGILFDYFGPGGDIVIPDHVTRIGEMVFVERNDLTGITVPDSVKTIGKAAFICCDGLVRVTIPEGVRSIGEGAFLRCRSLPRITIPNSVIRIGKTAFAWCESLKSISISDKVTEIKKETFIGCGRLAGLKIPDGVTGIGDRAFFWCEVAGISIPKSVTSIGYRAFGYGPSGMICHTPYAAARLREEEATYLIYLGGPLSDLSEKEKVPAVRGFFHALENGPVEIDRWLESYRDYIRDHIGKYLGKAEKNRFVLLFLIREKLLDENETDRLWACYETKGDMAATAALLQYRQEMFGTEGLGDLSI